MNKQPKLVDLKSKQRGLEAIYNNLKSSVSYLDFGHIHTTTTGKNEKIIGIVQLTQNNKLEKLWIDHPNNQPDKHIYIIIPVMY